MKKLSDKLKTIKDEYKHPDDQERIREWESEISSLTKRSKYYDLEVTKEITEYLKKRLKDIKDKLSSTEGMEREENLALHGRRKEIENLLSFFTKDPQKELEELEREMDGYLQEED